MSENIKHQFIAYDYKKNKGKYIFISYAHKDSQEVYKDIKFLKDKGFNIWYDEGIETGCSWDDSIEDAEKNCEVFLCFLSENFMNSDNCKNEVNYALNNKLKCLFVRLTELQLQGGFALRLDRFQAIIKTKYPENLYLEKLVDSVKKIFSTAKGSLGFNIKATNTTGQSDVKKNYSLGVGIALLLLVIVGFYLMPYMEQNVFSNRKKEPGMDLTARKEKASEEKKLFENAKRLISLYDYKEALEVIKKLKELNPNSSDYNYYAGISYENLKFESEALSSYEKSLALNPQHVEAKKNLKMIQDRINFKIYTEKATSMIGAAQFEKAAEILKKAIEINSGSPEAHYNLGNVYEKMGRNAEAYSEYKKTYLINANYLDVQNKRAALEKLLKDKQSDLSANSSSAASSGDDIESAINNAMKLSKAGKYEEAISEYKKLIEKKGISAQLSYNLAKAYEDAGEYGDALKSYEKAIEIEKNYKDAGNKIQDIKNKLFYKHCEAANKFKNSDKLNEAASEFEAALKINPDSPDANYALASVLESISQNSSAINYYRRTIELNPNLVDAHYKLAILYKKTGQESFAVTVYVDMLKRKPDDIIALEAVGDSFQKSGKLKEAVEIYKRLLNLKPESSEAKTGLFNAYYNNGVKNYNNKKFEDAVIDFDNSLKINPNHSQAHYYKGLACYKLDMNESAIKAFESTVNIDPANFQAYYGMGSIYYKLKDYERARLYLQKVLSIKPEHVESKKMIEQINSNNSQQTAQAPSPNSAVENNTTSSSSELINKGVYYYNNQAYDQAADQFENALKMKPGDPSIEYHMWVCKGMSKYKNGDYYAAISNLNNALRINGTDPELMEMIADAHAMSGGKEMAKNFYIEALKNNPKYPDGIREKLANVTPRSSGHNSNQRDNSNDDVKELQNMFMKTIIKQLNK